MRPNIELRHPSLGHLPVILTLAALAALGFSGCSDDGGANGSAASADGGVDGGGGVDVSLDGAGSDGGTGSACLSPDDVLAPSVVGRVYIDGDESNESRHIEAFEPPTDEPLVRQSVTLIGSLEVRDAITCDDGRYAFGEIPDGIYLVDYGLGPLVLSTSLNRPSRLPEAVREGEVTMVTFGDSLPVMGDQPPFPSRLTDLIGVLAVVDNQNVAVPGTTSDQWLPGTDLFDNTLVPLLADADLIVASLGGNDFVAYASQAFSDPSRASELLDGFDEELVMVMERMRTIMEAIREINAEADLVYILYPNYASSDTWFSLLGPFINTINEKLIEGLELARATMEPDDRIVLADMYEATRDLDLDDYLFDELHLNDAGHELMAEEIFTTLGGVRIGEAPLGLEQNVGIVGE